MVLFVNACARKGSRTRRLANRLLTKLGTDIQEIGLTGTEFPKTDEAFLAKRDKFIQSRDFGDRIFDMARDFASADIVVVAAPFWDLSFPAALKQYFEHINVVGLTFAYSDDGRPIGLCKAKKLYYVTTAGGKIYNDEYGFGYVKALAQNFYGIDDVQLIKAEGLDIFGADTEKILKSAEDHIDRICENE